jgi:nitroreductase/CTP:molybdopterin cytidylyltransferase MocA
MPTCAIITAAGDGQRMGQDKGLLDLGGRTALVRVVDACDLGGVEAIVEVRRADAAPVPAPVSARAQVVPVAEPGEMVDSVRAGLRARRAAAASSGDDLLVFPIDHALVGHETVATVLAQLGRRGAQVALPLWRDRPGHPVALAAALADEVLAPRTQSLRDVVAADRGRVAAVAVSNPWVCRDLDTPDDLAAARRWLEGPHVALLELMHRHRSRRRYRSDPLPPGLLERLVDAARHASTSSFIQAYSVVAVTDRERKDRIAALCDDQPHIRQAPVFLAICADLHKLELCCELHGTSLDGDTLELFLQATVDAALFGQNLQLAAEACDLGSCMIGAARNHPAEMADLLNLPRLAYVVFGMVVGVPDDDPLPRGRMPLAGVLHHERYDAAGLPRVLAAADAGMRAWARRTNAERGGYGGRPVNETKGWTDRMAALWGRGRRGYAYRQLLEPLRSLGFGLRQ